MFRVTVSPARSPSHVGPLRLDPGDDAGVPFPVSLALPLCPCWLALRAFVSLARPLIYYKGDADKGSREPLGIQCPLQVWPVVTLLWRVTGSWRWNFCEVCFMCVVTGVFFFSCPAIGEDTVSGYGSRSALGNVSLLSLWVPVTGSRCSPGARLGICGLALAL